MTTVAPHDTLMDFDQADAERLRQLRPLVTPHLDRIADAFAEAVGESSVRAAARVWLSNLFTRPAGPRPPRGRRLAAVAVDENLDPVKLLAGTSRARLALHAVIREAELGEATGPALGSIDKAVDLAVAHLLHTLWDDLSDGRLDSAATLAAGLAHELFNPLNAITLNVSLLERQLQARLGSTDQFAPIIEAMRAEVQRVSDFTDRLSEFARPLTPIHTHFEIAPLLEAIARGHHATLLTDGVVVTTDIRGRPRVYADRQLLEKALVQLLGNAIEAVERGGEIAIRVDNTEGATIIEVRDDGPGIAPASRDQVFDLFYTTKASGTGLGLASVKKIVDAHGGTIALTSESDRGTTIRLTLPGPRPERPAIAEEASGPAARAAAGAPGVEKTSPDPPQR